MTRKKSRTPPPSPSTAELTRAALDRYRPLLDADDFADLQAELERPLIPALRLNPLKATPADIEVWAQRYGWQVQPVPYCDHGWWIPSAETPISQTPEHHQGFYYIQDAASMLPVELFDFSTPTPLILDLAASPGGKTTHIIARTGDRSLVIANDSSRDRLTALRIVLSNWSAFGTAVTNFPGEKFGTWFPGTFDRVLLDAPCSMENLRSTESHPMRPITSRERSNLAGRQARLLSSALQAVRTGGQVVYSTCTLAVEEDEAVLDAVVKQYPGLIQINELSRQLHNPAPGLTTFGSRQLDPSVMNAARLWPHRFHTSGFFAASITRLGPLPGTAEEPPSRSMQRIGWTELDASATSNLQNILLDRYHFDLLKVIDQSASTLWQYASSIYALPNAYLARFSSLPVQGLGLLLGEYSPTSFSPSKELCSRFGLSFSRGKFALPDEWVSPWLRGEDLPLQPPDGVEGQILVITDAMNRNLGRGRFASNKIKNLLPRRVL